MKFKLRTLLILTSALATLANSPSCAVAQNGGERVVATDENTRFSLYVGSNARWLVDRRQGAVSAWSLEEDRPLWSPSGVVLRLKPSSNRETPSITELNSSIKRPTTEIFERVYFFLNDVTEFSVNENSRSSKNNLLVALDPRAQGRLVWRRRAEDFVPFFARQEGSVLRFLNELAPLSNDELLVQVQGEREVKRFALDAATGAVRLLDD